MVAGLVASLGRLIFSCLLIMAAIGCFATEPLTAPPRFAGLENVLLAPHSIAMTIECVRDMGRAAFQVMVDLSLGLKPRGALNPELFERLEFQAKWKKFQKR